MQNLIIHMKVHEGGMPISSPVITTQTELQQRSSGHDDTSMSNRSRELMLLFLQAVTTTSSDACLV